MTKVDMTQIKVLPIEWFIVSPPNPDVDCSFGKTFDCIYLDKQNNKCIATGKQCKKDSDCYISILHLPFVLDNFLQPIRTQTYKEFLYENNLI